MNPLENSKTAIIWNGDFDFQKVIERELQNFDFIICADGASNSMKKIGVCPDVIIGDLDSIDEETTSFFKKQNVCFQTFPKDKDFTDSELTIEYLSEHKISQATVFGAFGSRWDHSLANIGLLVNGLERGITLNFLSDQNRMVCLKKGSYHFARRKNYYFSIVSLFGMVENIYLQGGKYSLEAYTMNIGETIGVSNEYIDDITLSFEEGCLLVIESEKELTY